ncbi:hypothetical protein SNE40_005094 [Patella caerulea]|uniref:Uncharacterized protein n=1 Tax=Patella caerulea TaxID=87958 RepID=A0AAN8KBA2_PATCE
MEALPPFLLFLISCFVSFCAGHPHSDDVKIHVDNESHLYLHLLDDYYIKDLRPASASNDTVLVTVDITITAIHGLDEVNEELQSSVALYTSWQDPRLTWNTTDYVGLHIITVPASKVWKPELKLIHTQYGSYKHFDNELVTLHHDGTVTWSTHANIRSYCPLNIAAFPFDAHVCHLELASNIYSLQQVHLKFQNPTGEVTFQTDTVQINRNSQWLVSSKTFQGEILTVMHPESFEVVAVSVELARRSTFYQCVILGPAVVMSLLVPVVFLLPSDSSGKITLGGLIMVTMCLSMKMLVDIIGVNRATLPNIAIYYAVTMVLTSLSITMSAIVTSIARQGPCRRPVPAWFSTIFLGRCGLRRWLCMDMILPGDRFTSFSAMKQTENEFTETDSDVTALKEGQELDSKDLPKSVRVLVGKYQSETEPRHYGSEWTEIARVVDRLLFILFLALFVLTSLALLT